MGPAQEESTGHFVTVCLNVCWGMGWARLPAVRVAHGTHTEQSTWGLTQERPVRVQDGPSPRVTQTVSKDSALPIVAQLSSFPFCPSSSPLGKPVCSLLPHGDVTGFTIESSSPGIIINVRYQGAAQVEFCVSRSTPCYYKEVPSGPPSSLPAPRAVKALITVQHSSARCREHKERYLVTHNTAPAVLLVPLREHAFSTRNRPHHF